MDTATLLLLIGSAGSGKSALVRWLKRAAGNRVVLVRSDDPRLTHQIDPDGSDIARLLNVLEDDVVRAGEGAVLVFDDIDHDLREAGLTRFVQSAISQLDVGFLVLTMATPASSALFPIPTTSVTLELRRASMDDLGHFINRYLEACGVPHEAFSDDLRQALYELSEHTTDFNTVEFLLEMLTARWRVDERPNGIDHLHGLLTSDAAAHLRLPAIRVADGHRMSFRRKDKTELLADLLRKVFDDPKKLVDSAQGLTDFDQAAFLTEAESSYHDALVSLCLINSPLDLVLHLLGPGQIRAEIDALDLDPSDLFVSGTDQAHLLIRGLGFTLIGPPRGLTTFRDAVDGAAKLLVGGDIRLDVVNSAAAQVIQQVEAALRDLLQFWAAFFFGSLERTVRTLNDLRGGRPMKYRRLTLGEVVAVLRFLNESSREEEAAFRLGTLRVTTPISADLLSACEKFTASRNAFQHFRGEIPAIAGPAPPALIDTARDIVANATSVLDRADDGSFPMVIKLSEIVFDEYSRRIFHGVDADDNDVHFTLTDEATGDQLTVAEHYYILPRRRVSVNPHLVTRSGGRSTILFDQAAAYDKASSTQRLQSEALFDLISSPPDSAVIDVGCGTGRDALQLARRFHAGWVRGIDVSPDMLSLAKALAEAEGVRNLSFEEGDLLTYQPEELVDLVYSSSVMHWIRPAPMAYQRLFQLLRRGGRIVVHQGGEGTYRGLRKCARDVIAALRFEGHFEGWVYPLFYPSATGLESLLHDVGFDEVRVTARETDGSESPTLIGDFSHAGLLPYLYRLPETEREEFRNEFLQEARRHPPDLSTVRLYATARKP